MKYNRQEGTVKYVEVNDGKPVRVWIESQGFTYAVYSRVINLTEEPEKTFVKWNRVSFSLNEHDGRKYPVYIKLEKVGNIRDLRDPFGLSDGALHLADNSKYDLWQSISTSMTKYLKMGENGETAFFEEYSKRPEFESVEKAVLFELVNNIWEKRMSRLMATAA